MRDHNAALSSMNAYDSPLHEPYVPRRQGTERSTSTTSVGQTAVQTAVLTDQQRWENILWVREELETGPPAIHDPEMFRAS